MKLYCVNTTGCTLAIRLQPRYLLLHLPAVLPAIFTFNYSCCVMLGTCKLCIKMAAHNDIIVNDVLVDYPHYKHKQGEKFKAKPMGSKVLF